MINIYEQSDKVISSLNKVFQDFELSDSIQINENYIYIEVWLLNRQYKVRFRYTDKVYNSLEDLRHDILLHILMMVSEDRLSDPR